MGYQAGQITQGEISVAIGYLAGQNTQGQNAVAIGGSAGVNTQGTTAVAIGNQAGQNSQGGRAVAIGGSAGRLSQGIDAIAIGFQAGFNTQGQNSVAIGGSAGAAGLGSGAIAIGYLAGGSGANSIAVGYNTNTSTFINTIAIGASASLTAAASNSCYIRPINTHAVSTALSMLLYDTTTFEVVRSNLANSSEVKSFVIDHPKDKSKYLVHACLEGPESGVYYRGKGEITNGESVNILLPDYVDKLATDFTIQITPIFKGKIITLNASEVVNNNFTVYGENCKFFWLVQGKRDNIEVEPIKKNVDVKGSGPYKWI